jgi:hypothetical protein
MEFDIRRDAHDKALEQVLPLKILYFKQHREVEYFLR